MNSDIAHAAAYRPGDGLRMVQNSILNAFDTDLRIARQEFPVDGRSSSSRARHRAQSLACARVVARLHKTGVR